MIGRHKFASGVADSADTSLVLASDWNAEILLGYVLTNRTGGALTAGDVVAIDAANDKSVVLADSAGARRQYVVFVSALPTSTSHTPGTTINNLEQGIFLPVGITTVKVAGATTRGNYLRKSATAQSLEDTGVGASSAPPGDAIGTALTSTAGAGTVTAAFRGLPVSSGGSLRSVQVFTSSGTWTRPAGVRRVIVEVVGGGGSGGGAAATGGTQASGSGGGGGGGYARKLIDVTTISSATITVGAGGAAPAAGANPGNAGGASSWVDGVNTVTGNGGAGGNASEAAQNITGGTSDGGDGGTASGGDINIPGGDGGYAVISVTSNRSYGGPGGASYLSGSAAARRDSTGRPGLLYGGGGAGSGNPGSTSAKSAGAGAQGVVIVWEFE